VAKRCDVVKGKCERLSRKISAPLILREPEESFIHVPSPIEKFTLELVAWRGDDGDNKAAFPVTVQQAERIREAVGENNEDKTFPLTSLASGLRFQEAA
jgi:hypothetical protein